MTNLRDMTKQFVTKFASGSLHSRIIISTVFIWQKVFFYFVFKFVLSKLFVSFTLKGKIWHRYDFLKSSESLSTISNGYYFDRCNTRSNGRDSEAVRISEVVSLSKWQLGGVLLYFFLLSSNIQYLLVYRNTTLFPLAVNRHYHEKFVYVMFAWITLQLTIFGLNNIGVCPINTVFERSAKCGIVP